MKTKLVLIILLMVAVAGTAVTAAPVQPVNGSITEKTVPPGVFDQVLDRLGLRETLRYSIDTESLLGKWSADASWQPAKLSAGARLRTTLTLKISQDLLNQLVAIAPKTDRIAVLVTAERCFDQYGLQKVPSDETMSTLLTVTGLPIEGGGGGGAISRFTGNLYRTPVDVMHEVPIAAFVPVDGQPGWIGATTAFVIKMPDDMPPGIYRFRYDLGVRAANRYMDFDGAGIGARPKDPEVEVSTLYSPPIPVSGKDFSDKYVDATSIAPRVFWALLWDYNSNGYRGVIADEDKGRIGISTRNIIHDEVILPRLDARGNVVSYNLEPTFLVDTVNPQRNIAWKWDSGQWSVKVTGPDGVVTDLGTQRFLAKRGKSVTTKNAKFTAWKPPAYGKYTVTASGYIEDIWGNRYDGGGTYSFWIARRLTLATATFEGQPYPVGNRYGRDMAFSPAVPADVTVKADLYVNSDPKTVRTVVSTGKATPGGIFGAAQGLIPLPLDAPGEYHAKVTATYWDSQGQLWVCTYRHAGVVYPEDSDIVAHGKKISVGNKLVDRGETHSEGYQITETDRRLDHINFPYNAGDAILIASEHTGANKIEPVLTYQSKSKPAPYDAKLQSIGRSNVQIRTSNGLTPHMFPEYIQDLEYFYGSAPRPGFMSRFIVGEDYTRAPYWPTSRTNFGGQIGASNNGDAPGDIYRLLGGIVVKKKGQPPQYAGYISSAFILPGGSNNNRVVQPGSEDLPSPDGHPARFFMVPVRPGMVYMKGAGFTPVLQIDPIVPCDVEFTLREPDGTAHVTRGKADDFGYFTAKDRYTLDKPGVWKYSVTATWNGMAGRVPGLPDDGGWIFVMEPDVKKGGLVLNLPVEKSFSPVDGLLITGKSTARQVYYVAITPGAVLEQGIIPVASGQFKYQFDPKKMAELIKTYEIINYASGKAEIGRVVHLTFFSMETKAGENYHDFARVILRGTTAVYATTD